MDKKLTDNEIVKALKEILEIMLTMGDLQKSATIGKTLDLINRLQADNKNLQERNVILRGLVDTQKAEIERLKPFEDKIAEFNSHIRVEDMLVFASSLEEWLEFCDNLKAEAYKECLGKVRRYIKSYCNPYGKPTLDYDTSIKIMNFIDNLLKEMVGENK